MKLIKKILSYYPFQLPVGMTEFNAFADDIVELAGPIADRDSLVWVTSNEIMRMPPGKCRASKNQFVRLLRKYAANQIAAAKVLEIKASQEEKAKAEITKQKQQEEATKNAPQEADGTGKV